jgi:uncharacterized protein YjbI with pentapeptide repeats
MPEPQPQPQSEGMGFYPILFFGFGIAAGILIAFSGIGYLEDSAALIATVFLSALLVILLLGIILFAARRRIWKRLFGIAEVQIEHLATPLANIAEGAIARDSTAATMAARDLVALALARYSWITARRWIITSLTALIAAMAALAGTALLFKQNQLIAIQSGLLKEQNTRISEQSGLLAQQVQLAEADRNAQIAVEITQIAAELGSVVERVEKEYIVAIGKPMENVFNAIQTEDLPRALVLRITSTSRAVKPYRFLDLGLRANSIKDKTRIAFQRRRTELPNTYARVAQANGWEEASPDVNLIDRPASPERGQLFSVLMGAGLRNLETLNTAGLDLSFAHMLNANILMVTAQGGVFDNADFTGSHVVQSDFGGTMMENARFRNCVIRGSTFAEVTADRVRKPYNSENTPLNTSANGADFSNAYVSNTAFTSINMLAANFDGALLVKTDFTNANLGIATFRNTILIAPKFDGAFLKSADFDGAIAFGKDVLAELAKSAAPDTFRPDRFQLTPFTRDSLMKLPIINQNLTLDDIEKLSNGLPAFRIGRMQPFDDGNPPEKPPQ